MCKTSIKKKKIPCLYNGPDPQPCLLPNIFVHVQELVLMLEDRRSLKYLLFSKNGCRVAQACLQTGALPSRTSTYIVNFLLGQVSPYFFLKWIQHLLPQRRSVFRIRVQGTKKRFYRSSVPVPIPNCEKWEKLAWLTYFISRPMQI